VDLLIRPYHHVMVSVAAVLAPHVTEGQLPENRRLALSFQDQKQGGLRCLVTLPCLLHYFEQPSRFALRLNPGKLEEPLAMLALQPLVVLPGRISENDPHHHLAGVAAAQISETVRMPRDRRCGVVPLPRPIDHL